MDAWTDRSSSLPLGDPVKGSSLLSPTAADQGAAPSAVLRFVLPTLSLVFALGAMLVLVGHGRDDELYYFSAVVPIVVPWLSTTLSIVLAAAGLSERAAHSTAVTWLVVALVATTGWSVAPLLFDGLRIVRLIPLPLAGWGFALRLLLLFAAAGAIIPVTMARQARRGRCHSCRRVLPGALARVPRWPGIVAVGFALPYPVMRIQWALGGTFGTTGGHVDVDAVLQWSMAGAGVLLLGLTLALLAGRGPAWLRALLGLGGMVVGAVLATSFGPAAVGVATDFAKHGPGGDAGVGLMGWVPMVFYGSWLVGGLALVVSAWRYWVHRRDACPECGPRLRAAWSPLQHPAEEAVTGELAPDHQAEVQGDCDQQQDLSGDVQGDEQIVIDQLPGRPPFTAIADLEVLARDEQQCQTAERDGEQQRVERDFRPVGEPALRLRHRFGPGRQAGRSPPDQAQEGGGKERGSDRRVNRQDEVFVAVIGCLDPGLKHALRARHRVADKELREDQQRRQPVQHAQSACVLGERWRVHAPVLQVPGAPPFRRPPTRLP